MNHSEQKVKILIVFFFVFSGSIHLFLAQDDYADPPPAPPPEQDTCNGVFISYVFESRTKEYPFVKNKTAQAWAFKSNVNVVNTGTREIQDWKMFIGFQHREILVGADGAVLVGSEDFPADVSNGTYIAGYPQTDLMTSIDTAGDITKIQAIAEFTGTVFGVNPPGVPLPKTIRLVVDGYKCPAPTRKKTSMYACCVHDPKSKVKTVKTKMLPRQNGDLSFTYDVLQTYPSNYMAQVTMVNANPLGRLDHWNLSWEWSRGEFIYSMRGAYTHEIDYSNCIYGQAVQYYGGLDFSQVMNCQKRPVIADLPRERANDSKIGKIPYCCRNGSLLPTTMNSNESMSIFQLQVYKLPPDTNRTALYPPQKWKIVGDLDPNYVCGAPIRVDATEFPDPSGLQAVSYAIASWQVVCNISKPTQKTTKCCVSFSAYFNASVIPCNTCACGCGDSEKCSQKTQSMLLPTDAILVPFANRTKKAVAWAKIKHFHIPQPMPCGDNCGVSINWHLASDYNDGWSVRVTLFNWEEINFENWFVAVQMKKAGKGFDKAYSFNGTLLKNLNNTIFLQGLPGLNYLMGEINGTNPNSDPRVPGKQQSVMTFKKAKTPGLNVAGGDGFPTKVLFNGAECSLPKRFPKSSGRRNVVNVVQVVVHVILLSFVLISRF